MVWDNLLRSTIKLERYNEDGICWGKVIVDRSDGQHTNCQILGLTKSEAEIFRKKLNDELS